VGFKKGVNITLHSSDLRALHMELFTVPVDLLTLKT